MKDRDEPQLPAKLIQLTSQALDKYRAEQLAKIQMHLNENANSNVIAFQAMNSVVTAAIHAEGLPKSTEERAVFFESCRALASLVSETQERVKWESFRKVCEDQKVTDIPAHLVYAAKRVGVDVVQATDHPSAERPSILQG